MARSFFACLFRLAGEEENLFLLQHLYCVGDKQAIVACHCPNDKSKANINVSYSDFSLLFTSLFSYCKQILKKIQFQRNCLNHNTDHTQVVAVFFSFTSVVITVSTKI